MVKFLVFFCLAITLCWAGQPDIVRPCKLNNFKCIGANLAANSICNKNVRGYLPEPFYVDRFRFETPSFNSSYIDSNIIVKNYDKCFVSEFFVNRRSKMAVLGIDCVNLYLDFDRQLIRHHSLKEDTYYKYHVGVLYPHFRVTTNLPSSTHMDLCKAQTQSFTNVIALPKYHIAPKDQINANFFPNDLAMLRIFERENFFYRAFPITSYYIDSLICRYNCFPYILESKEFKNPTN